MEGAWYTYLQKIYISSHWTGNCFTGSPPMLMIWFTFSVKNRWSWCLHHPIASCR
uniref:Uncharacterized protein n=1 Tax=Arundo donax TaxID=35708 RepID=A0A0A9FYB3_ARUDO